MTIHTRLDRLEDDLHDAVRRTVADVVSTLAKEKTHAERSAFLRVTRRALALREAGVECPGLPTDRDIVAEDASVRLPDGAVLATAEEFSLYCGVAVRVKELWRELDGPEIGFPTE